MQQGLSISPQVIEDIDRALNDARERGLNPSDVHGRNVMMDRGRGFVVDVSDFLHQGTCPKWRHLKRAYYWLYRPIIQPLKLRIPYPLINVVRKSYRYCCRLLSVGFHFSIQPPNQSFFHPLADVRHQLRSLGRIIAISLIGKADKIYSYLSEIF